MKEIKFRAWDCEDEVMYHSDREDENGEGLIVWQVGFEGVWFEKIDLIDENPGNNGHVQSYKYVKPKQELMQYTGFKDKNGKDIYEGDIVRCWGGEYHQGYWEHDTKLTIKDMINDCFMMGESEFLEVIGNIYEGVK